MPGPGKMDPGESDLTVVQEAALGSRYRRGSILVAWHYRAPSQVGSLRRAGSLAAALGSVVERRNQPREGAIGAGQSDARRKDRVGPPVRRSHASPALWC